MNRIDRLTAIIVQLQSKRVVAAKEISERFNISLRTVYRDIRALEDAGVPIGARTGEGYFIEEGYHLPPVVFSREEAGALSLGEKLVEKFSDPSVSRDYQSALIKIKSVLGEPDKAYLEALTHTTEVLKSDSPDIPGLREGFLAELQPLIGAQKMLEIVYRSGYKGEETTRVIEPLGLCFWGANWHLIGYCKLRRDYRDFRVSRIVEMRPTGVGFRADRHDSLQNLIRKLIGKETLKPAVVHFDFEAAAFVQQQKYYHGLVKEEKTETGVEMTFMTPSYEYLSRWLLTFLDQIIVLSPARIKKRLVEYTRLLQQHYG